MEPWLIVLLGFQAALLFAALYLLFLTCCSLFYRRAKATRTTSPCLRLAVLVPAHNEEALLPRFLASLKAGTYPSGCYDVFVVADNCSDATAAVARAEGAFCYERRAGAGTGKGYALAWLLERVGPRRASYDAYVFVDADCEVSPNFLEALAERLRTGHRAVQAYYTASRSLDRPVAALRFAALVLKHYVRPRGRAVLGLPCGLFGTGMAFAREVIEANGWSAYSLAEDIEYQLTLASKGIYVGFAPEATVISAMPASLGQAKSQNLRWERGRLRLALRRGPQLLMDAVSHGSYKKLDILLEQTLPPLSVVAALNILMLPVAFATGFAPLWSASVFSFCALGTHVTIGLASARAPRQVYTAFLFAPAFIAWKLFIYAIALLPGSAHWVRTQRS